MANIKFKTAYGEKLHPAKEFDHTKISFKKAGQDINIYNLIQAGREDTEIYPTLEKYNMLPNIENAEQFCRNRGKGFIAEFKEMMDYRDFHEINQKAEEMWKSLPREVREHFHNDKEEFLNDNGKFLEELNKKYEKATTEEINSEANNEQK